MSFSKLLELLQPWYVGAAHDPIQSGLLNASFFFLSQWSFDFLHFFFSFLINYCAWVLNSYLTAVQFYECWCWYGENWSFTRSSACSIHDVVYNEKRMHLSCLGVHGSGPKQVHGFLPGVCGELHFWLRRESNMIVCDCCQSAPCICSAPHISS